MLDPPVATRSVVIRDFTWTLIRTDFKVRYHGAFGGFLWALAKPLVMFLVLYLVFKFLFPAHVYRYNLLIGILLWTFFAEGTSAGLESLLRKSFLLTKARFPRWIVVVTSLVNALLTLVVYAAATLVVVTFTGGMPRLSCLLLFLLYLVLYFAMVLGFSLATCALFLKYRDLNQVWDVTLQAGFFVAPIMYPISTLPERYHFWLYLWPPTSIIQFSRAVLLDGVPPTLKAHLLLIGMTAAMMLTGIVLFRRFVGSAMEML